MSDPVKVALIIGAVILVATSLYIHFSPFQTCVRAGEGEFRCALALGGRHR